MKVGLVGIGRMGRVLAGLLAGQVDLVIFDRNIEKMEKAAEELSVSTVSSLGEMAELGIVILALPDSEVVSSIKVFNTIGKNVTVINIATNVSQDMLNSIADSHVKCICAKFIGHAGEIALGHSPVIIVNQFPVEIVGQTVEIFQLAGQVIVGKADLVYTINTIAAQKAIEAGVTIEEILKKKGISDPGIIKSAVGQVAAGVMKSYANGTLGPFAREIVQSVKNKSETQSL
ncbi:NAD(P)-binding domain-containing protein [Pelosinus propionicus]|uniref:NAD binding domain of 6-phosphogluconate dehydrogenase n=1 Tax=Pelosinus propionicus DSM 13327 TaxID=1123291 RepID=A0A1I4I7S3_9FIRM|nr:NAD(P)-binding domain-containing protein [Pelosinus propionicus]SFL50320.1 NAD binding domain of 6-phosphogluconate dehydrogenase [Pelosinus propionicus DSM 13327]